MEGKTLIILLLGIFLTSSLALADTLVSSGNFYNMSAITTDGNGDPFWDNPSLDRSNEKMGYLMTSMDANKGLLAPNLQFLASYDKSMSKYNAVNDVYFSGNGDGQVITLMLTMAASAANNTLYAYNVVNPTQTIKLFAGALTNGPQTVSIPIIFAQWGLMITGHGGTFYSQVNPAGISGSSDATSNFAFFRDASNPLTYWVGIEALPDGIYMEGLGDYNDMILKISKASYTHSGPISAAPAPPTVLLLITGLLGMGGMGLYR